jgi:hypothetical protein
VSERHADAHEVKRVGQVKHEGMDEKRVFGWSVEERIK